SVKPSGHAAIVPGHALRGLDELGAPGSAASLAGPSLGRLVQPCVGDADLTRARRAGPDAPTPYGCPCGGCRAGEAQINLAGRGGGQALPPELWGLAPGRSDPSSRWPDHRLAKVHTR